MLSKPGGKGPKMRQFLGILSLAACFGTISAWCDDGNNGKGEIEKAVHAIKANHGHGGGPPPPPTSNGISYHGGPLLVNGPNVYYIWYGNWSGNTATTILTNFAHSIGGSPYFNINTTYTNGSGTHVLNLVNYKNSTTDNYSQGTNLTDAAVQAVVSSA